MIDDQCSAWLTHDWCLFKLLVRLFPKTFVSAEQTKVYNACKIKTKTITPMKNVEWCVAIFFLCPWASFNNKCTQSLQTKSEYSITLDTMKYKYPLGCWTLINTTRWTPCVWFYCLFFFIYAIFFYIVWALRRQPENAFI